MPGVVLHLEHHCLHVGIQGLIDFILCQGIVRECLEFILQFRAGIVLEDVAKGCLIGTKVLLQVVIGIQLGTACLDECFIQICLFESPYTVGGIAGPTDYDVAGIAMKSGTSVVEDIVGKGCRIVCPL